MSAAARIARVILCDPAGECRVTIKGRPVRVSNRGPNAHMGRFGGGWDRALGIQIGRRGLSGTVIVNLWRASVRIDPHPTK